MRTNAIIIALIALLACTVSATLAAPPRIMNPQVRFDNPWVAAGQDGSRFMEVEIGLPEGGFDDGPRAPLNLVLLIDRSGSMAAARKIDFVREAALDVISRLQEGDTFSLVTFSDYAEVVVPSSDGGSVRRLYDVINRIYPAGSTNLSDGLNLAYEQARRGRRLGGASRILLLTDGLANRGVLDPNRLAEMVAARGEDGIFLSTFGVGLEYSEDLLTELADAGRGSYWYIDRPSRIPEMISREFEQGAGVAFLDVSIIITFRGPCRLEHVYGYPFRLEDRRAVIHLGDLPAGTRRSIMMEVRHGAWREGTMEVGDVKVQYRRPKDGSRGEEVRDLSLNVTRDADRIRGAGNREVEKRAAVAVAGEKMKTATGLVDRHDFGGARRELEAARKVLDASPVKDESVRQSGRMIEGYEGVVSSAPSMAADSLSEAQKKSKFEVYRMQRSAP